MKNVTDAAATLFTIVKRQCVFITQYASEPLEQARLALVLSLLFGHVAVRMRLPHAIERIELCLNR